MRKTRNTATSFLESPTNFFPEGIRTNVNQMRKVQEVGLTDLEYQMEKVEFASGRLIDVKIAIDFLLLKENSKDEGLKIEKELKSAQCIIPLSCRRQSFYQSP